MKSTFFIFLLPISVATAANSKPSRIPANLPEIAIQCDTPNGFAGLSAQLKGVLKLSPLPNGAMKATGPVQISLSNPKSPKKGKRTVLGQYDDLSSIGYDRYFHGGAQLITDGEPVSIYINFTRPDMSYVEYAGQTYKTVCK